MTSVSKKIKKLSLPFSLHQENLWQYLIFVLLGYSSVRATYDDIHLGFIAFMLLFTTQEKTGKLLLAGGTLAGRGIMAVKDNSFLPYFIAVVCYIALYITTEKDKPAQLATLVAFAAGQMLFPYFYLGLRYKRLAVVQAAAMWCLSLFVREGRQRLGKNTAIKPFGTLLAQFIFCATVVFAFSGNGIVYTAAAFSLACCWLAARESRTDLCLMFSLCLVLSVADRNVFIRLLPPLGVCLVAGCLMAEKDSMYIYGVIPLIMLVSNMLFMRQLNGFGLLCTGFMALIFYTVIPHILALDTTLPAGRIYQGGKDYRRLTVNINRLTASLDYLGNCVVDISKINESSYTPQSLEDMVSGEMCYKCSKNGDCWIDNYSFTHQQFANREAATNNGQDVEFAPGFAVRCPNSRQIGASFAEKHRLMLSRRYLEQSNKNSTKILQSALLTVSSAVADLTKHSRQTQLVNTVYTQQMSDFLQKNMLQCTYCLCTQQPDKIVVAMLDRASDTVLEQIVSKAEEVYGVSFAGPVQTHSENEYIYTLMAVPVFSFEHSARNTPLQAVNGDRAAMFSNGENLFVILSDGMGTGFAAAGDSSTATEMAKSLLLAGVSPQNTISMVNIALNLRNGSESGATLDILCINLYTGRAGIYKAGAGETLVFSRHRSDRFFKESLPLGMVKNVTPAVFGTQLCDGDTVVMYTDGITPPDVDLRTMAAMSCKDISRQFIRQTSHPDDKTVVAIRIKTDKTKT